MLLRLKSLKALRLTIFHPRGSTDSELWIRVQPSDFPRLVHHCKRMKSYLTWAIMMRMSGIWVEKQRSCLISVGFERLTNTALRCMETETGLSTSKTKCATIDLSPVFLQWVYNWNEVKARVDNFIQISVICQSKPPVSAFARILTPDFISYVYFTKAASVSTSYVPQPLRPVYREVGTPGRWGNPLRWGNPPVHIISHLNLITFTW